jgi:hypothetical protein
MSDLFGESWVRLGDLDLSAAEPELGLAWGVDPDQFTGWENGPGTTLRQVQKPRQSGSWSGRSYATGRHVEIGGWITSETPQGMLDAKDRLKAACSLDETVLRVGELSIERWARVRVEDEPIVRRRSLFHTTYSLQLVSDDWRTFGADLTDTTRLPSTFGGLIIGGGADGNMATSFTPEQFTSMANRQGYTTNTVGSSGTMELYNDDGSRSAATSLAVVADSTDALRIPFTINAVTVTGQVSLINPGNETGPVRLRIDGPCRGPVVTHVATGAQLIFSSSLVLGYGEWIDVDMEARTVLANGQATRAPWITSRGWSGFTPGENTWSFTAAAFDAAALLTVVATPAWK